MVYDDAIARSRKQVKRQDEAMLRALRNQDFIGRRPHAALYVAVGDRLAKRGQARGFISCAGEVPGQFLKRLGICAMDFLGRRQGRDVEVDFHRPEQVRCLLRSFPRKACDAAGTMTTGEVAMLAEFRI